jgi:hypothetical protein
MGLLESESVNSKDEMFQDISDRERKKERERERKRNEEEMFQWNY